MVTGHIQGIAAGGPVAIADGVDPTKIVTVDADGNLSVNGHALNVDTGQTSAIAVDAGGRLILSDTDNIKGMLVELRTLTALIAAIGSGQLVEADDHLDLREVPLE